MNYRHAYHAGNFADVAKHVVLTLLLGHLQRKDTPFQVIDTHAGVGRYDLGGAESGKTGEFHQGIGKVLAGGPLPAPLGEYVAAIASVNPGWPDLRFYPGSPRIARRMLRPADRLTLVELHPEDAQALRREFSGDRQVTVRVEDAYQALKALLPPKERRGLVLIDPPFEAKDEFRHVVKGLAEALNRWSNGIFAIWYPIKTDEPVRRFLGELATFARPCLVAEIRRLPTDDPDRLNGCGMAVLNPPWRLDEGLAEVLPVLRDRLEATDATLQWVVAEV